MKQTLKRVQLKRRLKVVAAVIAGIAILVGLFGVCSNKLRLFELQEKKTNATTVTIADDGAIVCDSIIQGIRDCDLADGNYTFRVTGKTSAGTVETKNYAVELINYYDDVTYTTNTTLGDATKTYKMLVVKYHKNLTINSSVTVTANMVSNLTYKKGMFLCVKGKLTNNGTISMTARGTANCAGENVYLWKNADSSFEYVPATGGSGANSVSGNTKTGITGGHGSGRQTGGGASGGSYQAKSGAGAAGTSYSGGSGGGGGSTANGSNAQPNGGAGGARGGRGSGGGAGNPAASGGTNGTGGLLIVYTNDLLNNGSMVSNGSKGGLGFLYNGKYWEGGGSSGGGSINVFADQITKRNRGGMTANGGTRGGATGGIGGNGTVNINQVSGDLIYDVKTLTLDVGETYQIDESKLKYENPKKQTVTPIVGTVGYGSYDEAIADVNSSGKITAINVGRTKVEIRDEDNNLSTYIYIEVVDKRKIDMQEGTNFTVALKQNGSVWGYGLNTSGQVGNGTNDSPQLTPVQVKGVDGNGYLQNIKKIATGYAHALALGEDGKVYSWGSNTKGQLGNGSTTNSNVPVIVDGLSNIVKIDAYKNISIALDKDGKVYTWGEGYTSLPMRVIFSETVVDISGTLLLSSKGNVYNISNLTTPISGLTKIAKVSCGAAHNLALDTRGTVYAWGTNSYGECITGTTGSIGATEVAINAYDISAGNQCSMVLYNNGTVYVSGNNANGRIGLGTVAKTNSSKVTLSGINTCEGISAGEGTHTAIIDPEGFVWMTGTSTYGEIGMGNKTNRTAYIRTGDTTLTTNFEKKYLNLNERVSIVALIGNTFNLKKDIIDNEQNNFTFTMDNTNSLVQNGADFEAKQYGSTIITVTHTPTGTTKRVTVVCMQEMESIVQGFRDIDQPDGFYTVYINGQEYNVELINIYGDTQYSLDPGQTSKTVSLGDTSTEYKTLVVKYHGNLTIDKGVTVTAKTASNGLTYKKGMYLCVLGDIYNNGNISMTARGTNNYAGEDVYLWHNIDNSYEYVPAVGGAGGAAVSGNTIPGKQGANGTGRQTGGGASGAAYRARSGAGTAGTSYSGGSGGGGGSTANGANAQPNGGAGGARGGRGSGGGAGNPAASGGTNGTGGLLMLYADVLYNAGTITSNGSQGGLGYLYSGKYWEGGGSSGGGSINIFARQVGQYNSMAATGGPRGGAIGGIGGNGTVTVNEVGSILNYNPKTIKINVSHQYTVDRGKLSYTKLNTIQTEDLTVGNLTYESLDTNIAEVDANGIITGKAIGKTKIKITDTTNRYLTYIVIQVMDTDLVDTYIKEGVEYTTTLKANGTVWTYGKNNEGQLGNDLNDNSNTPVQVLNEAKVPLRNIKDIDADGSSNIAVDKNGNVYIWGKYVHQVNGSETTDILRVATKIQGLSNIEKVAVYNNKFFAISNNGKLYVFGQGYENPTDVTPVDIKVEDVSGNIMLSETGLVYNISNLGSITRIKYISGIYEISYGNNAYAALSSDGYVYTMGTNTSGQRGVGSTSAISTPTIVKTSRGNLENVSTVSAGYDCMMAVTYDGKAYTWGSNANTRIGQTGTNITYATPINKVQDLDGNLLELPVFEIVEAGYSKSSLMDVNGFVYSVGLNTSGQLGLSDNTARTTYTKIGKKAVITSPSNLLIRQGKTEDVVITVGNSFNLKTDLNANENVSILNTNEIKINLNEIPGVDNTGVNNVANYAPNYRIKANQIGRVCLVVETNTGFKEDVWVTVVNDDESANEAADVENGDDFSIALKSDGTIYSWGKNENGELGLGDTENRYTPTKINLADQVSEISVGSNHTLILTNAGFVYTFGKNQNGQIGQRKHYYI